ncbi:MAG: Crp/Fnr family transcriptional regulator [Candidatus Rifleibacteriota bacterium]
MSKSIIESFQKSELFREMPVELLESLGKIGISRKINSGEMLFVQNQPASGFYLIESGQIKIFRMSNDGREQILHLFEEGEVFGEVPVFQGSVYPAYAQSTKKSQVIFFGRQEFIELGKRQPEILLSLLATLSLRLRNFVELIDDFSLKDVTSRLAKFLCKHCQGCETCKVSLPFSKTELAGRLGTIPATLSRTFKKLKELKIIKVNGNYIQILDCDTLKAISHGEKPEGL